MTVRRTLALALTALLVAATGTASAALPQIDYSLAGTAGNGGWFRGPVTLTWYITGTITGLQGCDQTVLGQDTTGVQRTCTAFNGTASTSATTDIIKIDQTPPAAVAATPARPPDLAPFYTAPLPIAWSATDVTSGVASCTTTTYAGPDGPAVAAAGTCTDRAGNVSAPVGLTFAYDATPPALTGLTVTLAADRTATVRWTPGADAQSLTVTRAPGDAGAPARTVLEGPAVTHAVTDGPLARGMTYLYTVTVRDAAANQTAATATVVVPALATAASTTITSPSTRTTTRGTTLRWRARPGAKYYNLQLYRNGRKILSAWPTKPHYTLKASWRFHGRKRTLTAGRYRWYVWPGYGPRAAHRYGRLLAKGGVRIAAAKG